ncbi:MAG TPA: tRNA (N6-threonylcarbamoyladenosine(37)-N6)-methyltransferase TrmO [Syntrophobacteria bacterium]|nr:tRNA (N6-threonylcarbamoyladenosine(37)-N6)-methyltransferase TrmO [Syntrophobacteria bacterium]
MSEIRYRPIGTIHSHFAEAKGVPIQPTGAIGVRGTIEMAPEFAEGLKDLEGFSHILLIYHFHLSKGYSPLVMPFLDDTPRGVFATRAPRRPNSIGLSVVRLISVEGCRLTIEDVDIVDGTPLLDLKPYVPQFDAREVDRIGWFEGKTDQISRTKADGRFV